MQGCIQARKKRKARSGIAGRTRGRHKVRCRKEMQLTAQDRAAYGKSKVAHRVISAQAETVSCISCGAQSVVSTAQRGIYGAPGKAVIAHIIGSYGYLKRRNGRYRNHRLRSAQRGSPERPGRMTGVCTGKTGGR